jgi:hypothetical protein
MITGQRWHVVERIEGMGGTTPWKAGRGRSCCIWLKTPKKHKENKEKTCKRGGGIRKGERGVGERRREPPSLLKITNRSKFSNDHLKVNSNFKRYIIIGKTLRVL